MLLLLAFFTLKVAEEKGLAGTAAPEPEPEGLGTGGAAAGAGSYPKHVHLKETERASVLKSYDASGLVYLHIRNKSILPFVLTHVMKRENSPKRNPHDLPQILRNQIQPFLVIDRVDGYDRVEASKAQELRGGGAIGGLLDTFLE